MGLSCAFFSLYIKIKKNVDFLKKDIILLCRNNTWIKMV